jgi:hypothetical protein
MEGTDSYNLAIPDENKKVSEIIIEFAQGPGENSSPWGVKFDQPLNFFDVIKFGFPYHLIFLCDGDE